MKNEDNKNNYLLRTIFLQSEQHRDLQMRVRDKEIQDSLNILKSSIEIQKEFIREIFNYLPAQNKTLLIQRLEEVLNSCKKEHAPPPLSRGLYHSINKKMAEKQTITS